MNQENVYRTRSFPFNLLLLLLMAGTPALAQQRTLTGKINNEKGEGLPGATVLLKGTTTGTSTNADGNYTLAVPEVQANGTLVVSFIGYLSKEVVIGNQSTIDVTIEPDAKGLQEVIVVGYGTQRKDGPRCWSGSCGYGDGHARWQNSRCAVPATRRTAGRGCQHSDSEYGW